MHDITVEAARLLFRLLRYSFVNFFELLIMSKIQFNTQRYSVYYPAFPTHILYLGGPPRFFLTASQVYLQSILRFYTYVFVSVQATEANCV